LCTTTVFALSNAQGDAGAHDLGFGGPDAFGGYATTHILVRLDPALRPASAVDGTATIDAGGAIDALLALWGATDVRSMLSRPAQNTAVADQFGLNDMYRVFVPAGSDTPAMAADFRSAAGVIDAWVDGIGGVAQNIPNDAAFDNLWNMHNTGQTGGTPDADIDGPEAWDLFTGNSSVTIGIIDTGIQDDHPDLFGQVTSGWNTYDNNSNTYDPHGHGTHVSGTAGAIGNNGIGVAGVCWDVHFLAMRCVSTTGSGVASQCADAVVWATDAGIDIASMSLQYYSGVTSLESAINYAEANGVLPIAAAGNNQGNNVAYPARFPNCMAISATDHNDLFYSSSNWGVQLDVCAPGRLVYSLWRGSSYATISGTSMATPHVSGLAALIMMYDPCLTPAEVRQHIIDTVDDLGPAGFDDHFGWGRVNAYNALSTLTAGRLGDMNCDCAVDTLDIEPFIQAMVDPAGYTSDHPDCDIMRADTNGDGDINTLDIEGLVDLLIP
jgi:subtilisin family serine protease